SARDRSKYFVAPPARRVQFTVTDNGTQTTGSSAAVHALMFCFFCVDNAFRSKLSKTLASNRPACGRKPGNDILQYCSCHDAAARNSNIRVRPITRLRNNAHDGAERVVNTNGCPTRTTL